MDGAPPEVRGRSAASRILAACLVVAGFVPWGVLLLLLVLVFIVPRFKDISAQLKIEGGLPATTTAMIALSDFLIQWGFAVGPLGLFTVAGLAVLAAISPRETLPWAGAFLGVSCVLAFLAPGCVVLLLFEPLRRMIQQMGP